MTIRDDSEIPGPSSAAKASDNSSRPLESSASECNNGPFEVKKETLRASREVPRSQRKFALVSTPRESTRTTRLENSSGFASDTSSSADSDDDLEMSVPTLEPPERQYDCKHYETCLDLAASLNWISFSCKGCVGEVNQALYWRAHQVQRKDSVARALCELRPLESLDGNRKVGAEGVARPEEGEAVPDHLSDPQTTQRTVSGAKALVVPITAKASSIAVTVESVPSSVTPRIDIVIGEPSTTKSDSLGSKKDEQL